ncbi:MAG: AraC family transcriptional regulator, partial [Alphaproteobacteria bacterium]
YIHRHLDDELDLEKLADVACFSAYHWHRIYRSMVGETAAQTVRRLRLHRAAGELIDTSTKVGKIARRAGYASVEAFTRAFGTAYGAPPASFRATARPPQIQSIKAAENKLMAQVRIEQRPATRLATISHTGSYLKIGPVFARLFQWAGSNNLLGPDTSIVGIYHDDPAATAEKELRSQAGLSVPDTVEADDTISIVTLEVGRHAILRHTGPYEELPGAYAALFGTWLPKSGEEAANTPVFEIYLNDPQTTPPAQLETDICMALRNTID